VRGFLRQHIFGFPCPCCGGGGLVLVSPAARASVPGWVWVERRHGAAVFVGVCCASTDPRVFACSGLLPCCGVGGRGVWVRGLWKVWWVFVVVLSLTHCWVLRQPGCVVVSGSGSCWPVVPAVVCARVLCVGGGVWRWSLAGFFGWCFENCTVDASIFVLCVMFFCVLCL